jgi:putative transposase
VTANILDRKSLFQVDKIARLFIEVLLNYRTLKKYLLHEFVVMPDHIHLILTPTGITLERAMQFVKGGFSFQLNSSLRVDGMSGSQALWTAEFATRSNMRGSRITSGRTQ